MAGNTPAFECLSLAGCLKSCIKTLPENTLVEIGKSNAFSFYAGVHFFSLHALHHTLVERKPETTENTQALPYSNAMTECMSI